MGNILLFVWHSADLLLLTKSVAPQRTTSVRASIACSEVMIMLTVGNTTFSGIPGWIHGLYTEAVQL